MRWTIDPRHSTAHFSVRHLMIATVRGQFADVSGTVTVDSEDLSGAAVEAVIPMGTVSTRDTLRDAEIKGPNFFDIARFPQMDFVSTRAVPGRRGSLQLTGNLTLHGVTREVSLQVDLGSANPADSRATTLGLKATTVLNRKHFGLAWSTVVEAGGLTVGDEVKVTLEIQLSRAAL